jgi:type IV secretory pathway VirB2 component (pilin)
MIANNSNTVIAVTKVYDISSSKKNLWFFGFLALALIAMFIPIDAFAATTTGLPWETPLATLRNSLSGPVALAISIIAIVVTGCALVFGGEISEFARKMIMIVLVIAIIVAANSFLTVLFGAGTAVI